MIYTTKEVERREDAIKKKIEELSPRLLNINIGKPYKLLNERKVYVPYYNSEISYSIEKNGPLGIGRFSKNGTVNIIVDARSGHSFYLDLEQGLKIDKLSDDINAESIYKVRINSEDASKKAVAYARWKILMKIYRGIANVDSIKTELFYRPMWELELLSKKGLKTKLASTDSYDISRDRIKALKIGGVASS